MVKAALTRNARVLVGGPAWLVDLSEAIGDFSVSNTSAIDSITTLQSNVVRKLIESSTLSVALGTLYYGPESRMLKAHLDDEATKYCAVISDDELGFYCGPFIHAGQPQAAPTNAVITETPDLMQSEGEWAGMAGPPSVTAFTVTRTAGEKAITGTIPADADAYLVVWEYPDGVTAKNATIGTVTQEVGGAGIWPITLPGTAPDKISFSHTLAGNAEINGALLIGPKMIVD